MRIARRAATLVLVLAAAACGTGTIVAPEVRHLDESGSDAPGTTPPDFTAPEKGGSLLGSGY